MAMRVQEFLALVQDLLLAELPGELKEGLNWRIRFSLLQFYRETPRVHYEVWPQRRTNRLEIGLHFEEEREVSYRWAALLAERALEIQAALGPSLELEEWTAP